MRKLTHNEVIELRACKVMEDGRMEFFRRAERMYADETDTVKRLEELREMYLSIQEIPFMNSSAYGAYMKSMEMYYNYMDEMLADMGYTAHD